MTDIAGDRNGAVRPRLYVMKISHFCERARWGLDVKRIPHEEVAWAPGPHVILARRLKATATSLPILAAGGQVVQGSSEILSWAGFEEGDPAIERRMESVTAPLIRQYVYSNTLHDRGSGFPDLLLRDAPALQAVATRAGWPLIRREMVKAMDIRPALVPELEHRIDDELGWADTLVTDGAALDSDRFGRTEITVASLLAPLAMPDALPLYRELNQPPAMKQAFERWSDRPALRWVRSAYDRHRPRLGAAPAAVP